MFVLPSEAAPFDLGVEFGHPIISAVEIHLMSCIHGYPLPSFGVGVALVTGDVSLGREYPDQLMRFQ